ncbi:MAG: cell division protein SepF [Streptococcaceae bacterium]|jgi:cell division inhibitor SepF|nr:cell division protein SepF [Streptococcaceae bacterium]
MGLRDQFDKLRNYFVEDDDEEYDDDNVVEQISVREPAPQRVQPVQPQRPVASPSVAPQQPVQRPVAAAPVHRPTVGSNSGMTSAYVSQAPTPQATMVTRTNTVANASASKIMMAAPHVYADIMDMGKQLKSGITLIVNFKYMADQQARRSIDFLTGVAYILDGDIQNIGGQSFLVTPTGVDVDGAKESLLASGGAGFESFDLT